MQTRAFDLSLSALTTQQIEHPSPIRQIMKLAERQTIIDLGLKLKEAGATHLLGLYFAVNTMPELLDQMQAFAEEVMPHLVKA